MIIIFPVLYFGYKYAKKTILLTPAEVDLHRNLDDIAEYERKFVPTPPK
jgi:amino acid transporter